MSETLDQYILRRTRECGISAGLMQAYDALRERLSADDRALLLEMARVALLGEGNEPNS